MSDLPTRDDVKADTELLRRNVWTHNVDAPVPFSSILTAYVSGRLFDREAIDYEAEARKVHALVRSAYNQFPDEPRKPWDDLGALRKTGLIAMARDRVDAAIGGVGRLSADTR